MRTVTFAINITLDGYCDHTLVNPSPALHDYFTDLMNDVDLLFFGRVMYELMFPYWAEVAADKTGSADEIRFAEKITAMEKVVVSGSLSQASYNTRIIRNNPAEELLRLKQLPGKKISVDSVSLLPELIAAGLIDEFHLVVHPILAGNGRRLLEAGSLSEKLNLRLADTRVFQEGFVGHHYMKE